ncbi:MAG: cysteine--tRNA ligase [Minisyncoccia bacterium]
MQIIKIYNSLKRRKEIFKPQKDKIVKMYVCGPTVYGPSHLGHAVTYVRFDFIRRFLEFMGFKVKFVMNITDVHDDIFKKAKELKIHPKKLADRYTKEFYKDLESLKIKKAFKYPRVSEHIKEIISLIKILLNKKYAYESNDGVYFDISKFKNYGKLSGRKLDKAKTGTRIRTDKYEKEEVVDFALWKKSLSSKDEWLFDSPWGKGRPGWHIECSAMSYKYLGIPLDIHGGGMDLIFPHHENEIAQSESAFGKKFVNYFLHSGLLYINGKKMSKSLGNYIELRDFIKKYPARFLRFFILAHHWRSIINIDEKSLNDLWNKYFKINEFLQKIEIKKDLKKNDKDVKILKEKIFKALKDDLNSSNVINYILEFIKKKENDEAIDKKNIKKLFKDLDKFFLCFYPWKKIDKKTMMLIKKRERLRKEKKFNEADKIREDLKNKFIYLQDLKQTQSIIQLQ